MREREFMYSRRHIINVTLAAGFGAGLGSMGAALAAQDSTPAATTGTQPNGVLIEGLTDLPTAPKGEIAMVASSVVGNYGFMLLHNATDEEVILAQGACNALDESGNVLASDDMVNAAPYTLTPGGYGVYQAIFVSESGETVEVDTTATLEVTIPTKPLREATGAVTNMTCESLELDDDGRATIVMKNESDVAVGITPFIVVFFNDKNEIVGGYNDILFGPVSNGGTGTFENSKPNGEATRRFVTAAAGFES